MRAIPALGQNFLTDRNVIRKVIKVLSAYSTGTILEVGPGKGAFTLPLASSAEGVISIEKDSLLATELRATLSSRNIDNVTVINDDILAFDPSAELKTEYSLFGSLPYNISKRIIKRFLTSVDHKPTHIHVIIQREVADIYRAKPPKATYLSNFAEIHSTVDHHFTISKHSFSPTPAVDGAFITFTLKEPPKDHVNLDLFIRDMFKKPRKTIRNNLKFAYSDATVRESVAGIDLHKRPSELSLNDFRELFIVYNTQYNNGEEKEAKRTSTSSRT